MRTAQALARICARAAQKYSPASRSQTARTESSSQAHDARPRAHAKDQKTQALRPPSRQGLRCPRRLLFQFANWTTAFAFRPTKPSPKSRLLALPRRRRHQRTGGRWPSHLGQPAEMVRERCVDLFGRDGLQKRALRTSNSYRFFDPGETRSHNFYPSPKFRREPKPRFSSEMNVQRHPNRSISGTRASLRRCFDLLNRKAATAPKARPLQRSISHDAKFEPHRARLSPRIAWRE